MKKLALHSIAALLISLIVFCSLAVLVLFREMRIEIILFIGACVGVLLIQVVHCNMKIQVQQQNIEDTARTDLLTGLYNRHIFLELAHILFEKAKRLHKECYIVLFDLDDLKTINDRFGRAAGDEALRICAQHVKNTLRPYDLLARYSGGAFILFVTEIEIEHLEQLAERIRIAITQSPVRHGEDTIPITASFGIAMADEYDENLDPAIQKADQAMCQAKEEGRDRVVFSIDDQSQFWGYR